MQMTFRWYGEGDSIPIEHIKQIPCISGIVTAVYDTAVGDKWCEESFARLIKTINSNGLVCNTIESIPVHEEIKLGSAMASDYIENYKHNIRLVAKYGVKCICYNFMPVFDWIRSDLELVKFDGSSVLAFEKHVVDKINPYDNTLSLPGWDTSYDGQGLAKLLDKYKGMTESMLMANLQKFLREIIPVAEECGVKMAIHPDDPPWSCFGLPRVAKTMTDLLKIIDLYPSKSNCITLCSGSLASRADNDIADMVKVLGDKIAFVHLRNVQINGDNCFEESGHVSNNRIDMFEVVSSLIDIGYKGDIRPDHGRAIWGETPKGGYGLYDRALGAMYLTGLIEAVGKSLRSNYEK